MSEKKLWNQLKAGDKAALETIYRTYFKDLYSYGKKFAKDTAVIEDCIQELFIELWSKRENLSETDQIKPYLYVSIRRKILSQVKKGRSQTGIELQEYHFDAELSFEHILIQKEDNVERKKYIETAFEQLSDRQKEILYLKYYAQMDYDAISEIMDMNYQSARNLVSRAIAKLSKVLSVKMLVILLLSIKYSS